jgi:hypothetical protein
VIAINAAGVHGVLSPSQALRIGEEAMNKAYRLFVLPVKRESGLAEKAVTQR